MMNLIMPLKDPSPAGRARATLAIAQNVDEIFAGLDNVGTVHFARFLLLDDKICMISVYDGDFSNYNPRLHHHDWQRVPMTWYLSGRRRRTPDPDGT